MAEGTDSLGRLLERKQVERKELIYYLRSHGVIDEGYTQIATYANAQRIETDSLASRYRKAHDHEKHQVTPPLPKRRLSSIMVRQWW